MLVNTTSYSALSFNSIFKGSREIWSTVVLKVRLNFDENGQVSYQNQSDVKINRTDVHLSESNELNEVLFPCDVVPHKVRADIIYSGYSHNPTRYSNINNRLEANLVLNWDNEIAINNHRVRWRTHGYRYWEWSDLGVLNFGKRKYTDEIIGPKRSGSWSLCISDRKVSKVRLTPTIAYGGLTKWVKTKENPKDISDGIYDRHKYNPIGIGVLDPDNRSNKKKIQAHSMEWIESQENSVSESTDYLVFEPCIVGPLAPWSAYRYKHSGTYSEDWKNSIHPSLPVDFKYNFYNYSHPKLQVQDYILSGDKILLLNLHPKFQKFLFLIPNFDFKAAWSYVNGSRAIASLKCDTVHINFMDETKLYVDLSFRAWVKISDDYALEKGHEPGYNVDQILIFDRKEIPSFLTNIKVKK